MTCKGRITIAGETVTVKQEHEHPPDPEKADSEDNKLAFIRVVTHNIDF